VRYITETTEQSSRTSASSSRETAVPNQGTCSRQGWSDYSMLLAKRCKITQERRREQRCDGKNRQGVTGDETSHAPCQLPPHTDTPSERGGRGSTSNTPNSLSSHSKRKSVQRESTSKGSQRNRTPQEPGIRKASKLRGEYLVQWEWTQIQVSYRQAQFKDIFYWKSNLGMP